MVVEMDFEPTIRKIMSNWDVPGIAVGIVQDGDICYAQGFGVQSLDTGIPVTPESVFCVQSISKCFVATAVMQCAERGLLDLDTPLVEYLPYFRLKDKRYRQISPRQVLSHTSGMPDMDEFDYIDLVQHPEEDEGAPERFIRSLKDLKLVSSPGERFSYSNIAYNVLGNVLAKVTGSTFERVMKDHILLPARMANSTFLPGEVPPGMLAVPHLRSPGMKPYPGYPYHRADAPSSFLHTTVMDMCQWAITSLMQGDTNNGNILSPSGYGLMWTPVIKRNDPPSMYEQMGLGWNMGHFDGFKTVSHGGAGFGGTAFFFMMPEINSASVVLCNEESWACNQVSKVTAQVLTGHDPASGPLSWVVPVSRLLAEGGISTAREWVNRLNLEEMGQIDCDPWELDMLAIHLLLAKQNDLAIQVLGLNIEVHPEHIDSYLFLGKLYLQDGLFVESRETLLQAQSIDPVNASLVDLLDQIDNMM